ncbi:MAG TPA: 16S rRNA (guanine(527)-N(7))-methyltransferase RsmG [Solirubrobacterales bacterium]|nr:16S rRNA (guanine(527)-N(7))-methyltransferase RsmG [Solirubrobacterales bacterium]
MTGDPAAPLDAEQRAKLETVLALLAEERASVSSVVDRRAWQVHVVDSLTGLEVPELREAHRIADIGAGAGFPGLVLAVALPEVRVDLVESVSRKCEFMRQAIAAAGIGNAAVLDTRSESLAAGDGREAYDVVTARAVGRLSTLAELASPLLEPNGVLVAWKGKRDQEEERQLDNAAEALAMRPEGILDVGDRAGSEHRHLHLVRKSGPTPETLPRNPGIAKKRPKG